MNEQKNLSSVENMIFQKGIHKQKMVQNALPNREQISFSNSSVEKILQNKPDMSYKKKEIHQRRNEHNRPKNERNKGSQRQNNSQKLKIVNVIKLEYI